MFRLTINKALVSNVAPSGKMKWAFPEKIVTPPPVEDINGKFQGVE